MKKISTFTGMFFILFSLFAQQTISSKRKIKNHQQSKEQKKQRILTNAIKYGLDSLVSPNDVKYTFKYDEQGNAIERVEYYWEGKWITDLKVIKKYNDKNDLLLVTYIESGEEYGYEYEYTYDTQGNILEEIETDIENGQFDGKTKYTNTYDAKNNKTQLLIYNFVSDKWVESSKTDYVYDSESNNINEHRYKYTNNAWVSNSKIIRTYDTNNNMIRYSRESWDVDDNKWTSPYQIDYQYDANKNIIEILDYKWSLSKSVFDLTKKTTYSFNEKGQDTGALVYSYDLTNSTWINNEKEVYSNHDVNNNSNLIIHYTWDKDKNVWVEESKFVDTYDYSVSPNNVVMWDELFEDYLGKITKEDIYYWENDAWQFNYSIDYYYSTEAVSSISTELTSTTQIYPNPFTSELVVNFESITIEANFELFDVQGKRVFSKTLKNDESVDVSSLSKGIYFYQLTTDYAVQRGQLIK